VVGCLHRYSYSYSYPMWKAIRQFPIDVLEKRLTHSSKKPITSEKNNLHTIYNFHETRCLCIISISLHLLTDTSQPAINTATTITILLRPKMRSTMNTTLFKIVALLALQLLCLPVDVSASGSGRFAVRQRHTNCLDNNDTQEGRLAMEYEHERNMMRSTENAHVRHQQTKFEENDVRDASTDVEFFPVRSGASVGSYNTEYSSRRGRRTTFVSQNNDPIFV